MVRVGIVGFGNVGKAVKKQIENQKGFKLVQIFTRQNSDYETIDNIHKYKNKIDLLFLCVGSCNDLEKSSYHLIKDFDLIDCYDNHNRIKPYIKKLNNLAKKNKKIALACMGWDPGLFSCIRALIDVMGYKSYTFWGRGISQGHTNALKSIKGVKDALQFTLPNQNAVQDVLQCKDCKNIKALHKRECFVVADKNHKEIEIKIKNMKDYFCGYDTYVNFVSQKQLDSLKNFSHKGKVLSENGTIEFGVNLLSNPDFTAKIMINYAKNLKILKKLKKFGCFSILDLPMSNMLGPSKYKYL